MGWVDGFGVDCEGGAGWMASRGVINNHQPTHLTPPHSIKPGGITHPIPHPPYRQPSRPWRSWGTISRRTTPSPSTT